MSARTAKAVTAALAAVFLIAADATPESRIEQYQRLRREGLEAQAAKDLPKAEAIYIEALDLYPDVPGSYIRLARVQAAAGNDAEALRNVQLYASMGLLLDISRDPALKGLAELPEYKDVALLFADNAMPFGDVTPVATLAGDPDFIGESIVHDGKGWLLSTVAGRTIVRLDGDKASPFLKADAEAGAIFGMAIDRKRGVLWAAEAWGRFVPGGEGEPKTGLLKVSLKDGRILARYFLPSAEGERRQLGDVIVAADGTVYASDATAGGVWRLKPGSATLEPLSAGAMISAQGMAICPGGKAMLVADYSTGLHRVDLTSGETTPLEGLMAGLAGTDGLVAAPDVGSGLRRASPAPFGVIVTQNGVSPQRVQLLRISPDCMEIENAIVVAANLPHMDDLTLATPHDGKVVFIGHARWAERDDAGKATTSRPQPIRILQAVLPRTE